MNQELLEYCKIEIKDLSNKGLIRKSKYHIFFGESSKYHILIDFVQ